MKIRKAFRLSENSLSVIERVAKEKNTTQTEALETIIGRYEDPQVDRLRDEKWVEAFAQVLLEQYDQKYKSLHTRLRLGIGTAEFNSEVLLNAVNVLLFHFGIREDFLLTQIKMPVIEQSEKMIRERLAHLKQSSETKANEQLSLNLSEYYKFKDSKKKDYTPNQKRYLKIIESGTNFLLSELERNNQKSIPYPYAGQRLKAKPRPLILRPLKKTKHLRYNKILFSDLTKGRWSD